MNTDEHRLRELLELRRDFCRRQICFIFAPEFASFAIALLTSAAVSRRSAALSYNSHSQSSPRTAASPR
jgi:hypothetical protein